MEPLPIEKMKHLVEQNLDHLTALRHKLHQCPEPAFAETQTARLIADELCDIGLDFQTGLARTGLVADWNPGAKGKYIILRSDMDALPVQETTGRAYQSTRKGFAHSCGHDGNTAVLLGTARLLQELNPDWPVHIRFLFQPAEEKGRGAPAMIKAGALGNQKPDAFLTIHGWPFLPAGSVGGLPGPLLANSDSIKIKVIGRGGHGARPQYARNPLEGMAAIVDTLKTMNTPQRVVTLCTARVGQRHNTIADFGTLTGTLRTFDPDLRRETKRQIEEKVAAVCASLHLQATVKFEFHCPVVVNDPQLYEYFREAGTLLFGPDCVARLEGPSMGSEDFGCYLQHAPGFLIRLGMGENSPPLHQSDFDFNDRALPTGILILAALVWRIAREDSRP